MATTSPIKDLLDKLTWQRDAEALYGAFTEALKEIPDEGIRTEVCMNTVRWIATENATSRVKDRTSDEEVAGLFDEECKRLSDDLLKMPDQFREWLKKNADRGEKRPRAKLKVDGAVELIAMIDMVLGGKACDCERCVAFRASVQGESSETPTEIPPPPDPTN